MQPIPHKAGKYISRRIYGFLDVNPGTTPGRTLLRERKKGRVYTEAKEAWVLVL